jgi:hypothetical protein
MHARDEVCSQILYDIEQGDGGKQRVRGKQRPASIQASKQSKTARQGHKRNDDDDDEIMIAVVPRAASLDARQT